MSKLLFSLLPFVLIPVTTTLTSSTEFEAVATEASTAFTAPEVVELFALILNFTLFSCKCNKLSGALLPIPSLEFASSKAELASKCRPLVLPD